MKSKKKNLGDSKDIISGLPNALICHILSFVPTKEAASTSVLAKRWKGLFAFVPNLDFDDSVYLYPPKTYGEWRKGSESFMRFVDSVLAFHAKANTPLKSFHVKCKYVVDQYWVLDWITKVLKRDVSDIDLHIPSSHGFCSNSRFYLLPSKIFVSNTLASLKIQFEDGVTIDVEGVVSLPKLKILHLDYVKIETNMLNKLLSGCHVLEDLVLINLTWDSLETKPCPVTISIPSLKRLKFCRSEEFYDDEDFDEVEDFVEAKSISRSLSFDNPNLVCLEYSDTIVDMYQQVSFDSLIEASLRLQKTGQAPAKDKNNVTNILMGIRNVKILYLSDDTLNLLACCRETLPVFDNLIQLTIKTALYVEWKTLPPLLKSCPSLETLVFEGLHHNPTKKCGEEDGCLCKYRNGLGDKVVVRTCLSSSSVKVLKILNFGGTFGDDEEDVSCDEDEDKYLIEEQIEQVKHFLETMPDLEQLILYYNTTNAEDVLKKLQVVPRVASGKCNVQIISDNLSLSSTMST